MPNADDFHPFKSTSGGSNGGSSAGGGGGFGCGWIVIVIVAYFLVSFVVNGAGWDAIDTLLGLGFFAFLFFRYVG